MSIQKEKYLLEMAEFRYKYFEYDALQFQGKAKYNLNTIKTSAWLPKKYKECASHQNK
jgi:hypothetical protein